MIDGTGLFLVGGMVNGQLTADSIKNSGLYLSRVGIFSVDNNGYLVDDQKNYVYGYALKDGTGVPEITALPYTTSGTANVKVDPPGADGKYTVTILGYSVKTTAKDLNGQVQAWLNKVTKTRKRMQMVHLKLAQEGHYQIARLPIMV